MLSCGAITGDSSERLVYNKIDMNVSSFNFGTGERQYKFSEFRPCEIESPRCGKRSSPSGFLRTEVLTDSSRRLEPATKRVTLESNYEFVKTVKLPTHCYFLILGSENVTYLLCELLALVLMILVTRNGDDQRNHELSSALVIACRA